MGPKEHVRDDESSDGRVTDDDRSTVVPPSKISYSRSQGSFIEDEDYDNAIHDDSSTLFSSRSDGYNGAENSQGCNTSHKRSLSNERLLSAQLSQMTYNNNRISLGRAILQVQDLLQQVDEENEVRPIHMSSDYDKNLHVLKVQLKLDGNYSNASQFELDKDASAKVFRSQVKLALNHLTSLQRRVDETSSKVFITGDVNTGKSRFCNSLLKRQLLPEDQLPCTNVFCEILEARENSNIEEVHAITTKAASNVKDATNVYNIRDKSTYETFQLKDLQNLVEKSDLYSLLKIYIKDDHCPAESSLLRNGTVDISLIDSPGLNKDSVKTAEVMSRQEEIDLVIFVVNAENQLTLSANEFINLASREKKFMFFVVKKFDKIKDKQRCKDLILKQIKELSPESYKSSSQFVHFLSDGGDGPGGGPDSDPSDDDNDPKEPSPDFDHLENSLRNFVLKKRSLSKLLPAKTYLCKVLSDIQEISRSNMKIYKQEDDLLNGDLNKLRPEYTKTKQHCEGLTETVDRLTEQSVSSAFELTRQNIQNCLEIPTSALPEYQGLWQIHEFIFKTEQFLKDQIKDAITSSEAFAKTHTEQCVEKINSLGREKLGDDFMSNRFFNSDLMFTKRRHFSVKKLSVPLSMNDFFAPSWEGLLAYLSWGMMVPTMRSPERLEQNDENNKDSKSITGALGLANYSFTQYWTKPSLIFTSKLPTLAVYSVGGANVLKNVVVHGFQYFSWRTIKRVSGSILILGGFLGIAYLVHDLPRALPQNLSAKYKKKLQQNDYAHSNAERISKEVREVMRVPAREIVKSCELVVDRKLTAKRDLEKKLEDNGLSIKFFRLLLERATTERTIVERINLDVD